MLTLKADLGQIDEGLQRMIGDDLPFTIARFLTLQAQTGQGGVREVLPTGKGPIFQTRNDWTSRNIKITPATKESQFSEVYTDTGNQKTGAPDYLPRQDEGGEKVPLAGHSFLAIPTRYLRKVAPGVIPDVLRPKRLLPADANLGQEYTGSFKTGERPRRGLGRETRRKLGSSEYIAFVQRSKSGTLCIFVRHGGVGYHGGSQDAEPWYTLVSEAHIKARFPMEQIVQNVIETYRDRDFDRAAAEVLVNDALRSGLRVRF